MFPSERSIVRLLVIFLLLFFVGGCSWYQNTGQIEHLAEIDHKIYIATRYGDFKVYDSERNRFKKIRLADHANIAGLIPAGDALVVETLTSRKAPTWKTDETLYFVTGDGKITDHITVVPTNVSGQHESLLKVRDPSAAPRTVSNSAQ